VLHDVYVHAGMWFVMDAEGAVFKETIPPWTRPDIASVLANRYNSDRSALGVTQRFEDPVCIWQRACFWNYCHWHYDCLAALTQANSALPPAIPALIGPHMRTMSFFSPSLSALGPATRRLLDVDGLVFCRQLLLPSRVIGSVEPCRHLHQTFASIRDHLAPEAKVARRLYLARFDAPGRRELVNERELAEALQTRGFEIVVPGALTYAEQVRLLAEADIIIGPHGAGLTNIGFASPSARFVEIHPSDYGQPTFVHLALSRGQRTHCYFVEATSGTRQSAQMRIDVGAFLETLNAWRIWEA
jgi:capsular polysaccharide biosynthesis protein